MIKKFLSAILLFATSTVIQAYAVMPGLFNDTAINKIDAEKNAYIHNNRGLMYMQEGFYYGAIKEFKLAIELNPNKQSTAVYFANLGRVYLKIGYPNLAQECFERSIEQNPMDFSTYQNLATSYKRQNLLNSKLQSYKKSKNPLSKIMVGILLVETGQRVNGLTVLDEFCYDEPDLIITNAVKNYIQEHTR